MTKKHKSQTKDKFDKRIEHLPADIVSKIGQIDELKGQWFKGAQLSPQVLGRLKRSVLITSTGASTRIEGAHLSDEDVEKLCQTHPPRGVSDRETRTSNAPAK